jgi:hypothetical protein
MCVAVKEIHCNRRPLARQLAVHGAFSSNVLLSSVFPGSLILSGLLPLIHIIVPLFVGAKHIELHRYIRL